MFLGVADESQMNINCSFSKIGLEEAIEEMNSIEFIEIYCTDGREEFSFLL